MVDSSYVQVDAMRCIYSILIANILIGIINCSIEDFDKIHLTNSWAVHIENGNDETANEIAEKHGFVNVGQIGSLPGYFHFMHSAESRGRHRRDIGDDFDNAGTLLSDDKVKWVEQQHVLERDKRGVVPDFVPQIHPEGYSIQDPLFSEQWYLNNVGQASGPSTLDINVLPVWSRGISGKNVVVAILDDGLDHTHPDLRRNYDPVASYDFIGYDEDPMPRDSDPNNCHGTKCAGEVAAEAGNGVCGVGVAFNSSVAGIRMLDGNVTDTIEGSALSYKNDYIDIYSCAWGPKDDGKRFGRPGTLASKALEMGVKEGRNGLGNIFVWATGNGGLTDDDCNCDGYTTSVYTVSIGAISDHGLSTYYTESCSSTLAVTFSGGSHREKKENKIITTTLNHKCTDEFKGTSSAAPLAAGMIALMLEANSKLTWRDVQHIMVETTLMTSPLDEGWRRNGAGKWFNQKFGFGKLDASALVEKANNWSNVADQQVCWGDSGIGPWNIPSSGTLLVSMNTTACEGTGTNVRKLEHVQVIISLKHRHRGHVSIELISPSGTRTRLLKTRRNDRSTKGLKDWVFMSVHFWGEDPRGVWTLAVTDNDHNNRKHHRFKSKFGDTEDATEVLQDEMNGKDRGEEEDRYKSSEEFEDNIFKDSSFKHKNKGQKLHEHDNLQILRRKKMKGRKNAKIVNDHGAKNKGHSKGRKGVKTLNDDIQDDNKANEPAAEDEQALVEELLGPLNQTADDNSSKLNILNKTTEYPSMKLTNYTALNNNSAASQIPKLLQNATDTNESTSQESETKMLENLIRNIISQVFTNFASSSKQGNESIEERISTLESLLGKEKGGVSPDDKLGNGLMKAFKSGKAIDRVNNVLNLLLDSKNDTNLANTSFSRNAGVVVDVLKVLKDVLDTGKNNNKGLKSYKQRISNLLEKQSGTTDKLTKKLLSDLKSSRGNDNDDEVTGNVVNDALALISNVFKTEKSKQQLGKARMKKISSGKAPQKYRILFEGPNSQIELPYSSIQNVFATADGIRQVTKTSSSKEIQHDDNNVEKISVEHIHVKKGEDQRRRKPSASRKISSALQHAFEASKKHDFTAPEDTNFDDTYTNDVVENTMPLTENGFTLTITKNGEKVGERKVNNVQAMKVLDQSSVNPDLVSDLMGAEKKHSIKPEEGNIDVEVVVDGKDEDASKLRKLVVERAENTPKSITLPVRNHFKPTSVMYDIGKKKNKISSKKKNKKKENKTKIASVNVKPKNTTAVESIYNDREEEQPFFPINTENYANFPLFPGMESESLNSNPMSDFEFPFVPFPSYSSMTERYGDNSFENPISNPPYSVSKRSELYNYGYKAPSVIYPYSPFTFPLVRNYRSVDIYDEDDDERNNLRLRNDVENNDANNWAKTVNPKNQEATEIRSARKRRNLDLDDEDRNLIREKRNDNLFIDDNDDEDKDRDNEDDGPHVVKRSAIFGELYPSRQPFLVGSQSKVNEDSADEKRSAIRKALELEKTLKQKLFSMKKESSSALEIIKRVHSDIANSDSKDLRILEKELSNMHTLHQPSSSVSMEATVPNDIASNTDIREEQINSFMRLVEQTENSSQRKNIPEDERQNPDEFYKYGTSTSGILVSWTLKFYGTTS